MVGLIGAIVQENEQDDDPFSGGLVGRIVDLRPHECGSLLFTEIVYEGDEPDRRMYDVLGSLIYREPDQRTYTIKK